MGVDFGLFVGCLRCFWFIRNKCVIGENEVDGGEVAASCDFLWVANYLEEARSLHYTGFGTGNSRPIG